jgi:microcystin-dependent protein
MTDQYLGEIRLTPYNFAPSGWAMCNGQLMPIVQNTALFSLLGTQYGGDGRTTYALPNLQGVFPVHQGEGIGLSNYTMGEVGGTATVTLNQSQLPLHTHQALGSSEAGATNSAGGAVWAQPHYGRVTDQVYGTAGGSAQMATQALASDGGNQPHNNIPPYLAINFIIALQGIFPPRN